MTKMGMDVEAVESVGRQLKQSAASVESLVGGIDKTVSGLTGLWDGPDAQRFVQQSWPTLRKALVAAQSSVEGLGQSALNNASEQRGASAANGSGIAGGSTANNGDGVSTLGTIPGTHSDANQHGSTSVGALPRGDVNAYRQFEQSTSHYNAGAGYNVDANGKGVDNCTAWVDWRRDQLGLSKAGGNGGEMAGRLGGTTSTPASLGAVVSYYPPGLGGGANPNGHVMLVEQVLSTDPPSFRVSEDNYSNAFKDTRVWTQLSDGQWSSDKGHTRYPLTISPAA